jgi:hypothetical protein
MSSEVETSLTILLQEIRDSSTTLGMTRRRAPQKIISARRRNQHAGRVRYPEKKKSREREVGIDFLRQR